MSRRLVPVRRWPPRTSIGRHHTANQQNGPKPSILAFYPKWTVRVKVKSPPDGPFVFDHKNKKTRRRFSGGILVEIKREALCRTREGLDRPALEPPAEVAATYSVKSGTAKFPPRRKSMDSHQNICNKIPRKCSKLSLTKGHIVVALE